MSFYFQPFLFVFPYIIYVNYESLVNGEKKSCPAYLSYHLDKERLKDYEKEVKGYKHVIDVTFLKKQDILKIDLKSPMTYEIKIALDDEI